MKECCTMYLIHQSHLDSGIADIWVCCSGLSVLLGTVLLNVEVLSRLLCWISALSRRNLISAILDSCLLSSIWQAQLKCASALLLCKALRCVNSAAASIRTCSLACHNEACRVMHMFIKSVNLCRYITAGTSVQVHPLQARHRKNVESQRFMSPIHARHRANELPHSSCLLVSQPQLNTCPASSALDQSLHGFSRLLRSTSRLASP